MLSDLCIETERLIIVTTSNEENGDLKNYAILKNHSLTKDKINIDKIFCDSEIYTVVGYIHLNKNNYIEYEVYKPFRNMGFATEMLTAIKNYCLSQKVSPNLYINSLNDKSKNTAKKSGFIYEEPYDKIPNSEKWGIKK